MRVTPTDALALAARLRPEIALAGDAELCRALSAAGVPTLLVRDDEVDAGAARRGAPVVAGRAPGGAPWRAAPPRRRRRAARAPDVVSPREHDVLSALAAGATNPAIARTLGLSTNTVKQHASSIFRKLGARNRAEAVRLADDLGLI